MAARAMLTGFMVERLWAWYYSRYHMAGAVALYICIFLVPGVGGTASRPAATDDHLSSAAIWTFRELPRLSFCRVGCELRKSYGSLPLGICMGIV